MIDKIKNGVFFKVFLTLLLLVVFYLVSVRPMVADITVLKQDIMVKDAQVALANAQGDLKKNAVSSQTQILAEIKDKTKAFIGDETPQQIINLLLGVARNNNLTFEGISQVETAAINFSVAEALAPANYPLNNIANQIAVIQGEVPAPVAPPGTETVAAPTEEDVQKAENDAAVKDTVGFSQEPAGIMAEDANQGEVVLCEKATFTVSFKNISYSDLVNFVKGVNALGRKVYVSEFAYLNEAEGSQAEMNLNFLRINKPTAAENMAVK